MFNLLIVEDEALIAMMMEDALISRGHRVVGVADTLPSALDLAGAHAIDLALCDVRLANGDSGVEVATQLAQQGIPVVYVSGNCPADAPHPLVIGCVNKPVPVAALHATVLAACQIAKADEPVAVPPALILYR